MLDLLTGEIATQFDQKSMFVVKDLEKLFIEAANLKVSSQTTVPEAVCFLYSQDLDMQGLEVQLEMLPDLVQVY